MSAMGEQQKHGLYLIGRNEGWFIRIVGWRQLALLLTALAFCYWVGVIVGGRDG